MNPDQLRYMAAHVALHARDAASVSGWPARQIVDAFALLQPPSVMFSGWVDAIVEMTSPRDQEPAQRDLTTASVQMAENAKDLQRAGILRIEDAA